jgi:hypothetical protein
VANPHSLSTCALPGTIRLWVYSPRLLRVSVIIRCSHGTGPPNHRKPVRPIIVAAPTCAVKKKLLVRVREWLNSCIFIKPRTECECMLALIVVSFPMRCLPARSLVLLRSPASGIRSRPDLRGQPTSEPAAQQQNGRIYVNMRTKPVGGNVEMLPLGTQEVIRHNLFR